MLDEFDVIRQAEQVAGDHWRQCDIEEISTSPIIKFNVSIVPAQNNAIKEAAEKLTSAERDEEIRRITNREERVFTMVFFAIVTVLVIGVTLLFFH